MIPNRNWFKPTGFGSVRFGFLEQKPIQTGLARFWSVWLDFFLFGSVFSIWLGFFRFGSIFSCFFRFSLGSVRFFHFQAYKTKTEPSVF
jgi:hypothetical protein